VLAGSFRREVDAHCAQIVAFVEGQAAVWGRRVGNIQERGGGRARSSRLRRGNSLWRAAFAIVDEVDVLVNVEAIVERMLLGEQLRRSSWIGMILNELLDVESRVSTKLGEVRGCTRLVGGMFGGGALCREYRRCRVELHRKCRWMRAF